MKPVRAPSIGLFLLAVAGCTSLPGPGVPPDTAALAEASYEDRCAAGFRLADYLTARAGVRDAEAARVPGFPYLHSNRFLASFRDEPMDTKNARLVGGDVGSGSKRPQSGSRQPAGRRTGQAGRRPRRTFGWERRARRHRQEFAAVRPGPAEPPDRRRRTDGIRARQGGRVGSLFHGAAGLWALRRDRCRRGHGVRRLEVDNLAAFDVSPAKLPVQGELVRYVPESPGPAMADRDGADLLATASKSPLSILSFRPSDLDRLATLYAPVFEIDVVGPFDRPGRPILTDGPGPPVPTVDTGDAVVFFRLEHTRFQGAILPQLVYTVWFSERPPRSEADILSGWLDGIVWRVTLGLDGEPVVYDSIHPCGCYHLFFPVPPTERVHMPEDGDVREEALTPATAPVLGPGQRIVVRIASGSHYIQAVYADSTGAGEPCAVAIPEIPDGPLRMMPVDGNGTTRSLYGETGLIAGTERDERFLLWPMGIESAGAMRQWGTHATAFLGRRHFDDPDLLDRAFRR